MAPLRTPVSGRRKIAKKERIGAKTPTGAAFMLEQHDVLGGKGKIYRSKQSGDVWQFRMWVEGEKKYVRQTLKTRDLETAIKRAEERVFQIYSDVVSGKKLFSISLKEAVDKYLELRKEEVKVGRITAGRLTTIASHIKHLLHYKKEDTKLSDLDRESCFDFEMFRKKQSSSVKDVTIRNEQATINHFMKEMHRLGYCHFDRFEFRKIKVEEERRDTFTPEEYDNLIAYLRKWASKKGTNNNQELLEERLLIKDCILIASNTMLRVGELWQLTWGDVQGYEAHTDDLGKPVLLVRLSIRRETAKNRKNRLITTRGGEYFKRLYERTGFKHHDDFVFCYKKGSQRFPKTKFYEAWAELMKGIELDYKKRNVTWYSLRHFGITCRLRAGASVFDVSKVAGTGIAFIQAHYGHFDQEMSRKMSLKNFTISKEGIGVKD